MKTKQVISAFVFGSLLSGGLLLSAPTAGAQSAEEINTPAAISLPEMPVNRAPREKGMMQPTQPLQERVQARDRVRDPGAIAGNVLSRIHQRLNAALDRMDLLLNRLSALIVRFEERGRDLATVKTKAEAAKQAIAAARTAVAPLAGQKDTADLSALQELVAKARAAVRSAHQALVDAFQTFRAGIGSATNTRN